MTPDELWAFVSTRLWWIAGVSLAGALVLGGKCYGDAQYTRGRELARADLADSIGKVYESRFHALSDSMASQMAAVRAELAASNTRADAAVAQAQAAQAEARRVLTPQVIAQTPPEVLALVARQGVAIDTLMATVRDLRVHLSDGLARETRAAAAIELADSALAQKDRTILSLRTVKEPPHGFWHTVGVVASDVGLVVVGGGLAKAIFH